MNQFELLRLFNWYCRGVVKQLNEQHNSKLINENIRFGKALRFSLCLPFIEFINKNLIVQGKYDFYGSYVWNKSFLSKILGQNVYWHDAYFTISRISLDHRCSIFFWITSPKDESMASKIFYRSAKFRLLVPFELLFGHLRKSQILLYCHQWHKLSHRSTLLGIERRFSIYEGERDKP